MKEDNQIYGEWEKEFDEAWGVSHYPSGQEFGWTPSPDHMKSFIRQLLASEYKRGEEQGYAEGCSNPNYQDGYEAGVRKAINLLENTTAFAGRGIEEFLESSLTHTPKD